MLAEGTQETDSNMSLTAGIDIGATRIKAAVVEQGYIKEKRIVFLEQDDRSEEGIVERLAAIVKGFGSKITGVGIGVAGVIDINQGIIKESPNFPLWQNFPLKSELEKKLNIPVQIDNDANMVAWGEYLYGAGRGARSMILLTLGSGVGGGIILDGRLYHGERGMAGEIGHITVEPEGFACNCGNRGCLEQYASANGLRNFVKRDHFFGSDTKSYLKEPRLPEVLYSLAKAGNEQARMYFESFGYYLAVALGGLLNVLDVHLIVFSGGISESMDLWEDRLLQELQRRTFSSIVQGVEIKRGVLGDMAGVLGASALFSLTDHLRG